MPREGHDDKMTERPRHPDISIHVPREGHDADKAAEVFAANAFQSTCPARGTTMTKINVSHTYAISIHVPREGHDHSRAFAAHGAAISIHVPREGHDLEAQAGPLYDTIFQSTCPARGTTEKTKNRDYESDISIHVPREGHDFTLEDLAVKYAISIHVPREGHDGTAYKAGSTGGISIHVPREGHDTSR